MGPYGLQRRSKMLQLCIPATSDERPCVKRRKQRYLGIIAATDGAGQLA